MPTTGSGRLCAAGRAVEAGVAEGEDAAVGGDEPVALAVGRRRHADDRRVEREAAGAPVEAGVAEGEDAAVGRDEPVALAVGRRRHADDRLVEVRARPWSRRTGRRRRRRRRRRARRASTPWRPASSPWRRSGPGAAAAPAEPSKVASPKAKTPPSALASRYPLAVGCRDAGEDRRVERLGHVRVGQARRCRSRSCPPSW